MMAVLLLGAVVTFTGCSKQEIHSIDMNSGETEKHRHIRKIIQTMT